MSKSTDDSRSRAVQGDRTSLASVLRRLGPAVRRTVAGKIPSRWGSVSSEDDVMQRTDADTARAVSGPPRAYARAITIDDLDGKSLQVVSQTLEQSARAVLMLRDRAHQRPKESMKTPSRRLSSK